MINPGFKGKTLYPLLRIANCARVGTHLPRLFRLSSMGNNWLKAQLTIAGIFITSAVQSATGMSFKAHQLVLVASTVSLFVLTN